MHMHLRWQSASLSLTNLTILLQAYGWAYFWDTAGITNGVGFIRALRMLQVHSLSSSVC